MTWIGSHDLEANKHLDCESRTGSEILESRFEAKGKGVAQASPRTGSRERHSRNFLCQRKGQQLQCSESKVCGSMQIELRLTSE
jgi:hypothetical protein